MWRALGRFHVELHQWSTMVQQDSVEDATLGELQGKGGRSTTGNSLQIFNGYTNKALINYLLKLKENTSAQVEWNSRCCGGFSGLVIPKNAVEFPCLKICKSIIFSPGKLLVWFER